MDFELSCQNRTWRNLKEDNGRCENPENAEKPERSNKSKPAPQSLADILKKEKRSRIHGEIYHKVQVELTYNSNHMEGSHLTYEQTHFIFETNTVGDHKKLPNEVGGRETTLPEEVSAEMKRLLDEYNCKETVTLEHNIVTFIIEDSIKMFYYCGLHEWDREKGYLTDTCLSAQDTFKKYLDYFRIPYENRKPHARL